MAIAMPDDSRLLIWIVDAADVIGRSRRTIDRWIRDPDVPVESYTVRGDPRVYVDLDELEAVMRPRLATRGTGERREEAGT